MYVHNLIGGELLDCPGSFGDSIWDPEKFGRAEAPSWVTGGDDPMLAVAALALAGWPGPVDA